MESGATAKPGLGAGAADGLGADATAMDPAAELSVLFGGDEHGQGSFAAGEEAD
jgi:hypothetical protein